MRQGQRQLRRWTQDERVQTGAKVMAYGGSGFLLSAASISNFCQPLVMGLICAVTGWRALVMAVGSMLGFRFFWGGAGVQGLVWAAAGCILSLFAGKSKLAQSFPLLLPALAAVGVSAAGLFFLLWMDDRTPMPMYLLRICLSAGATGLFTQLFRRQDAFLQWIAGGVAVLALAQIMPIPYFGLGYIAAGALAVGRSFPAAVLAGMGLDLAQVTHLPITAVLCITYFLRLLPVRENWMRYAAPGAACLITMILSGVWDLMPLPGLVLGGVVGMAVPRNLQSVHHRGETGLAQVRLEMTAGVLSGIQQMLLETPPLPIDEEALLQKARERGCSGCSSRNACRERERMHSGLLKYPMDFHCRKTGRILPELRRAQEQYRNLKADRLRQQEYRSALVQQYQFLSEYMQSLADQLPRKADHRKPYYRIEVSARSACKEHANGDRCMAFAATDFRYYVLLCDGMGTGIGAAREGESAAHLLRQMLTAGFPPEHALRCVNSLLALRGQAGGVTVDLAEVRLDSGGVILYKWGAMPSWILRPNGAERIGTATAPPGILVEARESVARLSLRRGEALIMLSDGVDGEGVLRRNNMTPDAPPGELAERLLERGCVRKEDDATVVAVRLENMAEKQ